MKKLYQYCLFMDGCWNFFKFYDIVVYLFGENVYFFRVRICQNLVVFYVLKESGIVYKKKLIFNSVQG